MRRSPKRDRQRGNVTIEMTLVGLPLIFVLISVFEISRGMWLYHTVSFAVRQASRMAIVHGKDCQPGNVMGNVCALTVSDVAHKLANAAVGLSPDEMNATFTSIADTITCNPVSSCFSNTAMFPSGDGAGPGAPIGVSSTIVFRSAIAYFWPGSHSFGFGVVNLGSTSQELIQF
jgi:hypothetical protein